MSEIQKTLAKLTEINPSARNNETITSQEYLKRLALGVQDLKDEEWASLPKPAQDWFNAAADAIEARQTIPEFPDMAAAEPTTRRRRAGADDEPAAEAGKPGWKTVDAGALKKGDKVRVTNKRDKVFEGTVVDPDDKGELVIDDGKEEVGIDLDRVATVEVEVVAEEAPKSTGRRRAADEEDPTPLEPEKGDTVEVKTKRGKVIVGNIVEIDDSAVVVLTTAGEEVEVGRGSVESLVVKVKNAGKGGGGRATNTKDKSDGKDDTKRRATAAVNGGVSATQRMRELIVENLDLPKEKIAEMLKKEALEFKQNTLDLTYNDAYKLIGLLRAKKMLK